MLCCVAMTHRIRSRKTWDQTGNETKSAFHSPQPVSRTDKDHALIREDVPPRYEELLSQLEKKNREKKHLIETRDKDEREEGFSLYFNGTHAQKGRTRSKTGGQSEPAKPKLTKVVISRDNGM